MSGPTTAAELLELAGHQLRRLEEKHHGAATTDAQTDAHAHAHELAAAWPAFSRAGSRLLAALDAPPTAHQQPPPAAPHPADRRADRSGERHGGPERQLARAGDLVAAAADLLSTHDRTALPPRAAAADLGYAAEHLVAAARLVTTRLAGQAAAHAALLAPLGDAAGALAAWSTLLPRAASYAGPTTGPGGPASLADARTLPSTPTPSSPGRTSTPTTPATPANPGAAGPDLAATPQADLAESVRRALADWQRAALAALRSPAPSRDDLRDTALICGGLLALSQALMRAHAQSTIDQPTNDRAEAAAAAAQRIRTAGQAWTAAASCWRRLATGGRPDQDLQQAGVALDRAVAQLARTDGRWAEPAELRGRAGADETALLAQSALSAVQAVADRSAPLVDRLAATGAVYVAARQLPPAEDRLPAWAERRWLPLPAEHHRALTDAYRPLPALTAAARLAHAAATSPVAAAVAPEAPGLAVAGTRPATAPAPDLELQLDQGSRTLAARRWSPALAAVDQRLVTDPHLPALAAALDRVALAGVDVPDALAAATARRPLPAEHPARALHYRLVDDVPAASIPYTRSMSDRPAPARELPAPPPPGASPPRAEPAPAGPRR